VVAYQLALHGVGLTALPEGFHGEVCVAVEDALLREPRATDGHHHRIRYPGSPTGHFGYLGGPRRFGPLLLCFFGPLLIVGGPLLLRVRTDRGLLCRQALVDGDYLGDLSDRGRKERRDLDLQV